jgi:hypothetical protein
MYGNTWLRKGYMHVRRHVAQKWIRVRTETRGSERDTCTYETRGSERDTCTYGETWLRNGYMHVRRHVAQKGIPARTETHGSERDTCTYEDTWLRKGYLHVLRHVARKGIPARTSYELTPARTEKHRSVFFASTVLCWMTPWFWTLSIVHYFICKSLWMNIWNFQDANNDVHLKFMRHCVVQWRHNMQIMFLLHVWKCVRPRACHIPQCSIVNYRYIHRGTQWRSWSRCYKPEGRGFDS